MWSTPRRKRLPMASRRGGYTYQPAESDQVNLDNVLGDVNQLLDTLGTGVQTICRLFGC
jgi:hypothetical protein